VTLVEQGDEYAKILSDGEELDERRQLALTKQEHASNEILLEMRQERRELVSHFDKDTDLQQTMLISGISKVCVLGVIKYHQIR